MTQQPSKTAPAPIASKSEMKRVATLDPQKAAEELERLREEVRRLREGLEEWLKRPSLSRDPVTKHQINQVLALKDKGR